MHELSIAQSLIELALEKVEAEDACRITRLNLRIGRMAGIYLDALRFSFEIAAERTACADAELVIEQVPVRVLCPQCRTVKTIIDDFYLACPDCQTTTPEILSGQELEFLSMEVESVEAADAQSLKEPTHDAPCT